MRSRCTITNTTGRTTPLPEKGGVDHEHLVKTLMVHVQKVVATEVIVAEVQLDPALTAP